MLLLYDKVFFLPSDIHLNPGHTNLSKRFSMFDSILAGAFKSQKEAHYYNMYGSESDVWDDTMKRLMDLYDELEERKQISVLQEDSFSNVWEWHPLQVAVDADMQDSDFVTLCQKYRNKKIFIPMINNAKIKGGGNQSVALGQVILRFTPPPGLCLPARVDPGFQDSPPPQRPRPTYTSTRPAAACRGPTATCCNRV